MIYYSVFFLVPFILSLALTPIVRRIAVKRGLISYPRADRWHKHPTAILGGVAIYLSAVFVFIFLPINKSALGLLAGGTFLFAVGFIDDLLRLAPHIKLFSQVAAGCIAVLFGIVLGLPIDGALAIPLTLLWIIGITNSFNLLDNIDGLAAGIAAISSLMLFFSSRMFFNNPLEIYALVLAGACLGFLPYNFNPARIFMGDCGSMFLGFCLAVISVAGTGRHASNLLLTLALPVLILTVPIFDTMFVMALRTLQGRKLFVGGKDHTSHHLVTLGLSQRKTVVVLYSVSIAFGLIAVACSRLNWFVISAITFLAVVILLFLGIFLVDLDRRKSGLIKAQGADPKKNSAIANAVIMHKRRIMEVALDFIFICLAYYSAYFLRFEGALLAGNIGLLKQSLAWIILIKLSVFFIFGLYRGVWRYISITDLLTILKVVSLASIASIMFVTFVFRFNLYSRAVFFIDWLLLFLLVCGSRIMFRVLGEFFSRVREKGTNVLIFGAGDTGEMVIREIKRNKSLNYTPVGFIDDDPFKAGSRIQGVEILGSRDNIRSLVTEYDVKEILIAVPSMGAEDFLQISRVCQECGISYRRIKGILDKDKTGGFISN